MAQEELLNLMTILYVSIQTTLHEPTEMAESKKQFRTLSSHPTSDNLVADWSSCP